MRENTPGLPHYPAAHIRSTGRAPNAALLIDFDNVTMGIRSDLQNQLRALLNSEIIKGKVAVQRAYADWRRYPQYIVPLSEASIDLIFAPAFGSNKKNATDIRLAIDALELVFTRPEIGTFILLSGDSDFSSLVLKLKEYGKYVIGVGLRESASDLLVQNCDEYYGYNELTGLTREGEMEHARRDPWELVVEAVTQMKKEGDVMRSDRLKQVMQSIDPNFDEKDAGFSRFSKFLVEASQRGLVQVAKLENGQFAVDIGRDANVPPEEEVALRRGAAEKEKPARGARRRTSRRAAGTAATLTLAESFELLRQALLMLEAVGEGSTDADQVRAQMVELYGEDGDPVFERARFLRMLRQAHDADLIELVKGEEGVYRLKLQPQALVDEAAATAESRDETPAEESHRTRAPTRRATTARKSERSRMRSSRSRSKKAASPKGEPGGGAAKAGPAAETPAEKSPPSPEGDRPLEEPPAKPSAAKRNPRFRAGSRGGRVKPPRAERGEEAQPEAPVATASRRATGGIGSVGPRRGSRGQGRKANEPNSRPAVAPLPSGDAGEGEAQAAVGGGLLQRVSQAFQRVVRGSGGEGADRGMG